MRKLLTGAALAALLTLTVACGDTTPPEADAGQVAPNTPTAPAAPTQTVLRLALTARQNGGIVEIVRRDTFFTVEAGAVCSEPDLACPRPSRMRWAVAGAFCETLGDTSGPTIGVVCSSSGVTRISAISEDLHTTGETQIQVLF